MISIEMPFSRSMFSSASIISEFMAVPLLFVLEAFLDFPRLGCGPTRTPCAPARRRRSEIARCCRRRACSSKPSSSASTTTPRIRRAAVVAGADLHRDRLADARRRSARACAADVRDPGCSPRARRDRDSGVERLARRAAARSPRWRPTIASRSMPPSRSTSTRSTRAAPDAADLDVVELEARGRRRRVPPIARSRRRRPWMHPPFNRLEGRTAPETGKKKRGLAPTSPTDRWGPVGLLPTEPSQYT